MSMQATIESKIHAAMPVSHLQIINESHMHRGPAAESHFKLVLISEAFEGRGRVARHQMVYGVLAEELAAEGGIHALVLHTHTPSEWAEKGQQVPESARCTGGH